MSIDKSTLFKGVSIFPNPSSGQITIELGNLREVSINVFDAGGKLIYQVENINTIVYQFELIAAPGVYLIELSSNGAKQQYKLVKE
ncbi:MAG: T9SS type A sorting domain-containing protein [Bacteroidetes bacterium]|nr:T9SS type A sorting domain-containing protein [Bacteroidota bacterium]